MKIKFGSAILISLLFSMHCLFAFEVFIPLDDSQKIELDVNKFLYQGYNYSTYKTISWEMKNAFGVKKINSFQETNDGENINVPPVFCKGMDFSLLLNENWKLSSSFVAGFHQQNLPTIFTPNSLPYLQEDWASFNAEILISRKIPVLQKFSFSPFVGYDYNLFTFSESDDAQKLIINKKHSVIVGVEILWNPVNRVEISGSAFTSLLMDMNLLLRQKFYAGTKFNVSVSIYKFYLNFFNSIKFNFSKIPTDFDFLPNNLQSNFSNFYSIELGLGFRVAI